MPIRVKMKVMGSNPGYLLKDFLLYCPNIYTVYTGYPRRVLNDDSKSLGDLGLLPTGILHLVRNLAHNTNTNLLLLWTLNTIQNWKFRLYNFIIWKFIIEVNYHSTRCTLCDALFLAVLFILTRFSTFSFSSRNSFSGSESETIPPPELR